MPGDAAPSPPSDAIAWPADPLDSGLFAAGTAMVHLRGNAKGVVLANGSDFGPQPVTMYMTEGGSPPGNTPDWVSADAAYHTGVCVGDLDGDGHEDLVVTELGDSYSRLAEGGVKVYFGTGAPPHDGTATAAFDASPRWLLRRVSAVACAVGDLDGNGTPDVVVASLFDAPPGDARSSASRAQDSKLSIRSMAVSPFAGAVRVLYDPKRGDRPFPVWRSDPPRPSSGERPFDTITFASGVRAADVDGDGVTDIAVVGSRVAVYYGSRESGRATSMGQPGWISAETFSYAPSIDVVDVPGEAGSERRTLLVASRSCMCSHCCKPDEPTGYFAYQPKGGPTDPKTKAGTPIWSKTYALDERIVGPSTVLDLDGDGSPDLLTSLFWSKGSTSFGAGLGVVRGRRGARPFDDEPGGSFNPRYQTVVGGFSIADFAGSKCPDLLVASASPLVPSTVFLNPCPSPRR